MAVLVFLMFFGFDLIATRFKNEESKMQLFLFFFSILALCPLTAADKGLIL